MPSYTVICDKDHITDVYSPRCIEGNKGLPECCVCAAPTKKYWGASRRGIASGDGDWGEAIGGVDPETGAPITIRNEAERRALEEKWRRTSGCPDGVLMTESPAQAKVKREEAFHRRIVEGRRMGMPDPVMTRRDFWG